MRNICAKQEKSNMRASVIQLAYPIYSYICIAQYKFIMQMCIAHYTQERQRTLPMQ